MRHLIRNRAAWVLLLALLSACGRAIAPAYHGPVSDHFDGKHKSTRQPRLAVRIPARTSSPRPRIEVDRAYVRMRVIRDASLSADARARSP